MGADGGNGKRGSAKRLESSHGLFSLSLSVLLLSALQQRTDPACTISKANDKEIRIATGCKKRGWNARTGE
jgi:hypothetical protein